MADPSEQTSRRDLKVRIQRSRVMTPELRRYWLDVLPHLSEADCSRLRELLEQEASVAGSGPLQLALRSRAES